MWWLPLPVRSLGMIKRKVSNKTGEAAGRMVVSAEKPSRWRGWLFGAYTFLFLWSLAFLFLFFTNRLPV